MLSSGRSRATIAKEYFEMQKLKRVLNVKVSGRRQLIELMQALGEMDADIIAESRPGSVKIRIYGEKDEVRALTKKILALTSRSQSS